MSDSEDAPTTAEPLSNQDFRKLLSTTAQLKSSTIGSAPQPSTKVKSEASVAAAHPTSATSAAATSKTKEMRYADGEMKTVKFTRHGLEGGKTADGDEGDGDGMDEGDDESSFASHAPGGKKGARVLSSRERSYLAFQAKQALKTEAKTRYRDRAKERQQDINPDYEPDTELPSTDAISIEASKYLGGDLAHTHLVKGLDFALLNKVREEIEKKDEERLEKLIEEQEQARAGGGAVAAPAAATSVDVKPIIAAKPKPSSHSLLATSIYELATAQPKTGTDLFLPGRMTYNFPLHTPPIHSTISALEYAQQHINALPSSTITSHSDLAAAQANWADEHVRGYLPEPLWTKVVGIFRSHHEQDEERRKQRKLLGHAPSGYNVTKEDHKPTDAQPMEIDSNLPPLEPAAGSTSTVTAMEMDYSVPLPPPAADSDDDDIFADAGHDYQAQIDEPVYDVPRPPPAEEEDDQPMQGPLPLATTITAAPITSTSSTKALFSSSATEPAVRQLDKLASRLEDDSEDEDDIFVSATAAGDELLAGSAAEQSAQPLTEEQKRKRKNAEFAEAEYEELFPGAHSAYSTMLDDFDDEEEESSKRKKSGEDEEKSSSKMKGGRTRQPSEEEQREAKFNAEFSQVSQMLKARGVKGLNDDMKRRQTKKTTTDEDDERAIKRQKILRGFAAGAK